jgi:hypothetical protein
MVAPRRDRALIGDYLAVRAPTFTIKGEPLAAEGRPIGARGPHVAILLKARRAWPKPASRQPISEERLPCRIRGRRRNRRPICGRRRVLVRRSDGACRSRRWPDRQGWAVLDPARYRIQDGDAPASDTAYTLQGLIDALSRRRKAGEWTHSIEAGPFRIQP